MTLTDFGINAVAAGWGSRGGVETVDIPGMMAEIKKLGATRVRIGLPWSWVETKRGGYTWVDMDPAIDAATDAGLTPLVCFDRIKSGAGPEQFGDLCEAAAEHFGDAVTEWEIFNEVNAAAYFPGTDPLDYLDYLRAGSTALKSVQPDCTVVTAGLVAAAGDEKWFRLTCSPVTWYDTLYRNGAKDLFDALGMHLYPHDVNSKLIPVDRSSISFVQFEAVRAVMEKYDDGDKQIWVTEWGEESVRPSTVSGKWRPDSWLSGMAGQRDRVAAQMAIMEYYDGLGWLGPQFAFNLRDWKALDNDSPSSHYGLMDYDLNPKPVYYVWLGRLVSPDPASAVAGCPVPAIEVVTDPNQIYAGVGASAAAPFPAIDVAELLPSSSATAATPLPALTYLTRPTRVSVGDGGIDSTPVAASTGIDVNWDHDIAATGAGHLLLAGFVVSHDILWDWTSYNTLEVTSSEDGAFTRLASRYIGASGGKRGSVHIYGLWNPSAATHTITAHVVKSSLTQLEQIMGNSAEYVGVGAVVNATSEGSSGWTMSMNVSSASDDIAVVCAGFSGTPGTFSQNTIYADGASAGGQGDYIVFGDAPGAPTVNFAVTTNRAYGAVGINLAKIA